MHRVNLLAASLALVLMAAAQPSPAALPPGISGSWYNPEQPGHGIAVQMIAGTPAGVQRSDAFWFVYDTEGHPLHLYLVGEVVGESIQYIAYENRGMRFGVFDPSERTESEWGTVTLAFDSCEAGTLSWQASDPDYGSGSMPMVRLASIAGLPCQLGLGEDVADAGKYHLEYPANMLGSTAWLAAMDTAGQVWATPVVTPSGGYVGPLAPVVTGVPSGFPGFLEMTLRPSVALSSGVAPFLHTTEVEVREVNGRTAFGGSFSAVSQQQDFAFNEAVPDSLERSFDTAELAGRTFAWKGRSQFFNHDNTIRFLADGSFCIDTQQTGVDCTFSGQLGAEEPGLSMFAFTGTAQGSYYVGKGWLEPVEGGGEQVVLVGIAVAGAERDGGLGVVGVEQ